MGEMRISNDKNDKNGSDSASGILRERMAIAINHKQKRQ